MPHENQTPQDYVAPAPALAAKHLRYFLPWIAAIAALSSCSDQPTASPQDEPASEATEETAIEVFGAASIEDFKKQLHEAFVTKDYELYRRLHCWDRLPGTLRAALSGAVKNESLKIFTFVPAAIEIEAMNQKETSLLKEDEWNLLPTHWVLVNGQTSSQFKHWELGQLDGRYYLATRLK